MRGKMEKKTFGSGPVNNEVDFCRVYDQETRKKIEKILLDNRISYCCHFEDKGFLQKFFFTKSSQNTACVFRIHDEEVPRAKKLVRSVLGDSKKRRKESRK